jgi:glycosyltransferase involved in cell wall biosynthesis
MPVWNAATYLPAAIESILSQTFTRFEFIIIDDASTDDSWKIIKKYTRLDKRIRAYKNKINLGVSLTSNIAIAHARCQYLARMDADDISVSNRLEKQLTYLQKHKKTVLVGGQCTLVNEQNQVIGTKSFPTNPQKVKNMMFWAVPTQQGYMMVNRSLLPKKFNWYEPSKRSAEEVDLYFQLIKYGDITNLPDNLYFYRQVEGSLSRLNPKKTFALTLQSRLLALKNGYQPTFLSILINLAQIFAISILPSNTIYHLWYLVRGVTQPKSNFPVVSFSKSV